ncbi:hypothetical protein OV203_16745 [Nannocystis sp. ILAH1]|uniref:hypothetical protein n=1 Tax=Nannocystis sp. ILAH1 TaxID=2996789 RepID=UPI00226DE467|nr:hypothetical protein [Nannocystis sp. ILAH1]MCY0988786.1 hypothetical protein [Nannocystis sp. ILAH1]
MDPSAYRSLAFLFSFGTLPIACGPKDGDTTDGSTGGTDPSTGTTDGTPATTSGEPTSGSTTTTADTTDTDSADQACQAYVDYLIKCDPEAAQMQAKYFAYCAMIRTRVEAVYGAFCLSAHDAVYECLLANPCDDLSACDAVLEVSNQCQPEAGATCVAYAAKEAECYDQPEPSYAAGACQAYINNQIYDLGPACGAALEEYFACLTALPCPEFEMGSGCDVQEAKIVTDCGGMP